MYHVRTYSMFLTYVYHCFNDINVDRKNLNKFSRCDYRPFWREFQNCDFHQLTVNAWHLYFSRIYMKNIVVSVLYRLMLFCKYMPRNSFVCLIDFYWDEIGNYVRIHLRLTFRELRAVVLILNKVDQK